MVELIPSYDMTFKQKILAIVNLILFSSLIASLVFRTFAFILFGLIISLLLYYVYLYEKQSKKELKENLALKDRAIIDDIFCVKPSKNNPFMNPNITDINKNYNFKACNIDNKNIKNEIDKYFKGPIYKDVNDIYERNISQRQFYTVPATTIPNDQEAFSHWLYHRNKTCKENNGEQCFNNIM